VSRRHTHTHTHGGAIQPNPGARGLTAGSTLHTNSWTRQSTLSEWVVETKRKTNTAGLPNYLLGPGGGADGVAGTSPIHAGQPRPPHPCRRWYHRREREGMCVRRSDASPFSTKARWWMEGIKKERRQSKRCFYCSSCLVVLGSAYLTQIIFAVYGLVIHFGIHILKWNPKNLLVCSTSPFMS